MSVWKIIISLEQAAQVSEPHMYVRQHPGAVIRELWLDGESPADAAARIGISVEELLGVLDGRVPLTSRLAARLAAAGWSTAAFWLRLQDAYDQAHRRAAERSVAPLAAVGP